MAQNTTPIYTSTPHIGWATTSMSAANTSTDGTGTSYTVFTAGSSGSYVQRIIFRPAAITNNTATVARVFINNGLTSSTPANNIIINEISLPATTATSTAALQGVEVPLNFTLPVSYSIFVTMGATTGNGWYASCIGGDY